MSKLDIDFFSLQIRLKQNTESWVIIFKSVILRFYKRINDMFICINKYSHYSVLMLLSRSTGSYYPNMFVYLSISLIFLPIIIEIKILIVLIPGVVYILRLKIITYPFKNSNLTYFFLRNRMCNRTENIINQFFDFTVHLSLLIFKTNSLKLT